MLNKCDNCSNEFDADTSGIVATSKTKLAAAICDGCLTGARLIKLVLRQGDVGTPTYDQFSVIEMKRPFPSEHAGKGLSTPIGTPKR